MPHTPPFRANHIGSLLRPAAVKDVRLRFVEEVSIPQGQLRAPEQN